VVKVRGMDHAPESVCIRGSCFCIKNKIIPTRNRLLNKLPSIPRDLSVVAERRREITCDDVSIVYRFQLDEPVGAVRIRTTNIIK